MNGSTPVKKSFFERIKDNWRAREARRKEKLRGVNEKFRKKMQAIDEKEKERNIKYREKMEKYREKMEKSREKIRQNTEKIRQNIKHDKKLFRGIARDFKKMFREMSPVKRFFFIPVIILVLLNIVFISRNLIRFFSYLFSLFFS